ncbi:MAG: SpoIIE family protein phosphatase [Bacteroidia bacterium]|nr:SpoIIE family protein phosphatase [Bacteroidia bacterium]
MQSKAKIFISTLSCLLLFSVILDGQTYRFKNYGIDSKIPNGFIYTLNQDNNGYLWIGTGNGLSKFDGFDFYNIEFPDSLPDRYPTSSLKDNDGTLWFGCNDGSVFFTENGNLKSIDLSNTRSISAMLCGPDGFIYVIPQSGSLFRINSKSPKEIKEYSLDQNLILFSACLTQSGDILLGTQENILICRVNDNSFSVLSTIEGFDYSSVLAIHKINDKDNYLIGTDGKGLFKLVLTQGKSNLKHFGNRPEIENLSIQSIFEDSKKSLWLATNESGILQIDLSAKDESIESLRFINKNSGLPGNNIKVIFQDIEENLWIGLFGDGLSMLNSLAFSFYMPGTIPERNNIIYTNKIDDDYFLGTPTGFYLFDIENNRAKSFTDLNQKTGNKEIASYCVDNENNIWIGTKGAGLYLRNKTGTLRRFYNSGNSGQDFINDVKTDKKYIWLGTLDGVIILNKFTGDSIGGYNINNGLPHNSINQIYITSSGNAAIATKTDRLYLIDPEKGVIPGKAIMSGTTMNEISSIGQTNDGNIWASSIGNGVFELYGDSIRSFTKADMLMSDYCHSLLVDSINRIWIGHQGGFSRYNRNTGIMRTYGTDFARSGDCNMHGMYESSDGKVLIGTTQGLIVYDRNKDKRKLLAPLNNINYITINDVVYPLQSSYTLPYKKRYHIMVNYVGISLKDPDKVYYQTRLDNYENDWSKLTTDRETDFSPGDGRYKFNMRSVNEDGLSSESPVTFDLLIKKPVWRTWWFIFSSIAILTGIIILIIRQREKEQKKIQAYLEKELEARTSVVLKQKDKIELQNLEITDSINYAKRIQTSILPDIYKLKETFKDAFVFFRPRDIVSGDFYWFEKMAEDKFILVCADSTGHGVPGAFMSMIGSTLLQDIVSRQHITRPSQVLKMLDTQIFSTLNQNLELGVSNDGMDMVICEINIKTRHIIFASAMRPVILVLDGEPQYIKGNRSSVGGESVIEKYFDDQEYYLNNGDTLYLFSDGLPDQFGGIDGKKMKIARLKKLIEDVTNLPLNEQKESITKFYDEWKGDYDQVDDVLLIGVRL